MESFRVGLNKLMGIMGAVLAVIQLALYTMNGKGLNLALLGLWCLVAVMYFLGPCFEVVLHGGGDGEVHLKNPFGMTLKRHAFASLADLTIAGGKLFVKTTAGEEKKLGGFGADGGDMRKLESWLEGKRRPVTV